MFRRGGGESVDGRDVVWTFAVSRVVGGFEVLPLCCTNTRLKSVVSRLLFVDSVVVSS